MCGEAWNNRDSLRVRDYVPFLSYPKQHKIIQVLIGLRLLGFNFCLFWEGIFFLLPPVQNLSFVDIKE